MFSVNTNGITNFSIILILLSLFSAQSVTSYELGGQNPYNSAFVEELQHRVKVYTWKEPDGFLERFLSVDTERVLDDIARPSRLADADVAIYFLETELDILQVPIYEMLGSQADSLFRHLDKSMQILSIDVKSGDFHRPALLIFFNILGVIGIPTKVLTDLAK